MPSPASVSLDALPGAGEPDDGGDSWAGMQLVGCLPHAVHSLEGEGLLLSQHQPGAAQGHLPPVQLHLGPLRQDGARLQAPLHPGQLSLRVLTQPGALDPGGRGPALTPPQRPARQLRQGCGHPHPHAPLRGALRPPLPPR